MSETKYRLPSSVKTTPSAEKDQTIKQFRQKGEEERK